MAFSFSRDPYSMPERELTGVEKLRLLGSLALLAVAVAAVMVVRGAPQAPVSLEVGDVGTRHIVAPRSLTYVSQVLTERARQAAEAAVGTVYDAPDSGVARHQVSLARQTLDRIDAVLKDSGTSLQERAAALARVADVSLSETSVDALLTLSADEWLQVETETVRVLDQSMRSVIRDADLLEARRRVAALVSFDLRDAQAAVVVELVTDFVQPNTLPNEVRTTEAKRRASESVGPVTVTFEAGQVIVRAGDRVTELQVEALQQIGLMQPARDWREDASALLSVLFVMALVYLHVAIREPDLGRDRRRLALFGVSSLAFAALGRLVISDHVLLPYVYPAAALPMLVAALVSPNLALVASLLPAALYVQLAQGAHLELATFALVGGIAGALMLSRLRHLKTFVWAAAVVLVANTSTLALFRVLGGNYDPVGLASLLGAAIVSAALSGTVAITGYLLVGGLLGTITPLQLLELSRPTQPLLRELLLKAPGTYNHSLMVANMAEQAAERIGANALLSRVGAYYHDIGKVARPYFYSENQQEGANIHDRLDPRSSAAIIVGHVTDGAEMGRRQRLPPAIIRFIAEHHGCSRQDYFYSEEVKRKGQENVDEESFRYPGPRPRSKETAIVMLADACEASFRATKPGNVQNLARLIERLVDDRMLEGELDESPLTLHDIAALKASFVNVLQGSFHLRVQYPDEALIERRESTDAPEAEVAVAATGTDDAPLLFARTARAVRDGEPEELRDRDTE